MSENAKPNLSPTFLEMAARIKSKARSLRYTAGRVGHDTPKGRTALADAEAYDRIAAGLLDNAAEQLAARDGMLTEYRKARANA